MKICVLTHTFPRNNQDVAAAFMKSFCDGLVLSGNKVFVLTPFDPKFDRKNDLFKVITYRYITPDFLHLLGYSKTMEADAALRKEAFLLIPFMVFFGVIALFKLVKKEGIELINVHWILPNGLIALIVSKLTGVPFVVTIPGTDAYLAKRFPLFGLVAKIIADNSAALFSNSSYLLKMVLSLGVKKKVTDVISYPIDVSEFKPKTSELPKLRDKLKLTKDNLVILAIGRLVYKKGFDYLIKAMTEVVKEKPKAKLLIGGEGILGEKWSGLVDSLGLQDKIFFLGTINRDEVIDYYNLADVLVAPSIVDENGNVDGGPVVCFESMACGKAQVVTDVLGVADLMEDEKNGYIVPQKDPKALARSLIKLLNSESLRSQMGRANILLIKNDLTTKSIGQRYTNYFRKIVGHN